MGVTKFRTANFLLLSPFFGCFFTFLLVVELGGLDVHVLLKVVTNSLSSSPQATAISWTTNSPQSVSNK